MGGNIGEKRGDFKVEKKKDKKIKKKETHEVIIKSLSRKKLLSMPWYFHFVQSLHRMHVEFIS